MTVREAALQAVRHVNSTAVAQQRLRLTEWELYYVLRHWQIPVAPSHLASGPDQAAEAAAQLEGPVAVKIVSPDILHKSDVGCVRTGLQSGTEVMAAYTEVLANARSFDAQARIDGVLVQQMAPPGIEIIAGGTRDDSFGPVLMVGLGGIFTEVLKDVTFRLAPVTADRLRERCAGGRRLCGAAGLTDPTRLHYKGKGSLWSMWLSRAGACYEHGSMADSLAE